MGVFLLLNYCSTFHLLPIGGRFGRSSREPKYKVEFHPEHSPFHPHEGWWTYEFCFRKHVKQLHVEDEKVCLHILLRRMFQQEQPMWHTIHCNEVGADSKISTVEDGLKGTHITIIADDSA
ncbi:hypothetical protein GW17_00000738 [Ensete ventricosum]|nr:hypothetical protein GW17_00000738 [Ensete ventricosum]